MKSLPLVKNCYGELGISSNETVISWRQVNRCLFDCQVHAVFAGSRVTLYITQSGRIYGTGQWKCLVNSTIPLCIPSINPAWRIKEIAISKNQIILVSSDGCIFGVGDNSLGELGLCHTECVIKPVPLTFFHKLNRIACDRLCNELTHPYQRGYNNKYNTHNSYVDKYDSRQKNRLCNDKKFNKCGKEKKCYRCKQYNCKCRFYDDDDFFSDQGYNNRSDFNNNNQGYNNNNRSDFNDNDNFGNNNRSFGNSKLDNKKYIPNYRSSPFAKRY